MTAQTIQKVLGVHHNRGPVEKVPVTINVMAYCQDNGDGTWTAVCPALTQGQVTAPSKERALQWLADSLSESFMQSRAQWACDKKP